jgi:hypothetical protein
MDDYARAPIGAELALVAGLRRVAMTMGDGLAHDELPGVEVDIAPGHASNRQKRSFHSV